MYVKICVCVLYVRVGEYIRTKELHSRQQTYDAEGLNYVICVREHFRVCVYVFVCAFLLLTELCRATVCIFEGAI